MWDSIKQTLVVCLAGLILLPLTYWAPHAVHAADGAHSVPAAFAVSGLGSALLPYVCTSILILILALVAGKLTHRYTGAFVLGLGWLLMSIHAPTIDSLIRSAVDHDSVGTSLYIILAVESLVWAAVSLVGVWGLDRWTPNRYPQEASWTDKSTLLATGVALALGCAFCWGFLRTDLKGQTLYGTVAAIALAVMIARMTWPTANGTVLFVVPFAVAVVAYVSSIFMVGNEALSQQLTAGLWPPLRPIPLDYAAGGMIGVSVGISLARSFSYEEREVPDRPSYRGRDTSPKPAVKLIRRTS